MGLRGQILCGFGVLILVVGALLWLFQQHNLEQPQQRRHHQDKNAEPAEDLPPDAQGAPGPQKTLTCLQNDTPPLSR